MGNSSIATYILGQRGALGFGPIQFLMDPWMQLGSTPPQPGCNPHHFFFKRESL